MRKFGSLALLLPALALGAEFYVSPSGSPAGNGSQSSPWDLATALAQPSTVRPGDTIWMLAGTYGNGRTHFESELVGQPDAPIIVRNYRNGRATINGELTVGCCNEDPHPELGANVWFWGLEVTSSITDRTGTPEDGASQLRQGVNVYAPGAKIINMVIHDTAEGIGLWTESVGGEAYGNLIYHNGYQASDRGHGHGIYAQNKNGRKLLSDNIIFNQFGIGIHIFGSGDESYVRNFDVIGNISFNNGILCDDGNSDNLLIGGGIGNSQGMNIRDNHLYHTPELEKGSNTIGVEWEGLNEDVVLHGNYFIGGVSGVDFYRWSDVEFTGNTVYSVTQQVGLVMDATSPPPPSRRRDPSDRPNIVWDDNRYFGEPRFAVSEREVAWDSWPNVGGFDTHSGYEDNRPTGIWSAVRPNKYEPGRANIVIYNWELDHSVTVDVSEVLPAGTSFEIRDAQNFYGSPVASGVYQGGSITIPMTGLTLVEPHGDVEHIPPHTAPQFGTFVLLAR